METKQNYGLATGRPNPYGQTASPAYLAAIQAPRDFRDKITASIGTLAVLRGCNHTQAYSYLSGRMLTVWGIEVDELPRLPGESLLTTLVRYRLDSRFYALIQAELNAPAEL